MTTANADLKPGWKTTFRWIGVAAFLGFAAMLWDLPAGAQEGSASQVVSVAQRLIRRVIPRQANQFVLEQIPADHGHDVFELESRDGKIVLRGNNAVSIASALNQYLEQDCHCDISWHAGDQLDLPRKLPAVYRKIRVVSPCQYRYAYNFCTYGYTMAWWHWPEWERELDFLALKGVNLALAIEGQESVWVNTFTNFGYSEADLRGWVVDPAHLPWFEMDNMESYGGPLSPQLVARRLDLGRKIIARMRELGIEPVLPGYYGMVPPDFHHRFAQADVRSQGDWARLKRPDILDPTDPLFPNVAASYYAAQQRLFGGARFYDADPFHEGGSTKGIDIPAAGRAIFQAMNGATWVLQSWEKNPRPEMIDPLDKPRLLVLDLYCEDHENWRLRNNFDGAPWLWCAINCFGGNMKVGGRLAWMAEGPARALADPDKGRMAGLGAAMEATGVNPVLWEMLLAGAWRTNAPRLETSMDDYARRRYGAKIPDAEQAWQIMAETVYDAPPPSNQHTTKPAVCSRPTLVQPKLPAEMVQPVKQRPVTRPDYDPARLLKAWQLLLAAAPEAKSSAGYRFDLADVGLQVLANLSASYNQQIVTAYESGDAGRLRQLSHKMLGLIRDMDRLAGTQRQWLLGVWLDAARSWGATPAEKDLCERNARELLTTWTRYDNIPDYANREWNGLLGGYYYHRWQMWLKALNDSLAHGATMNEAMVQNQIRDWEMAWTRRTRGHFATKPRGDVHAISKSLAQKYAPDIR